MNRRHRQPAKGRAGNYLCPASRAVCGPCVTRQRPVQSCTFIGAAEKSMLRSRDSPRTRRLVRSDPGMPDTVQPRSKKDPTAIPPRSAQHPAAPTSPLAHGADFPVVAIGASTGGLEACRKLLDALPADTAMAFILVQHLDSTQDSLLVDLLAERTALTVLQATDGMPVEPGHLYVIPPGTYLSVKGGALRLSQPTAPRGVWLPFDFLLHSLADRQRRAGAQPRPGPRPVHRATARRDAGAPRPRPVPAGQGIRCSPSRSRASRTGVRQRRRRRLRPP